ncbi:OSTF1, partial [Cervus elaphus hippelaphus]
IQHKAKRQHRLSGLLALQSQVSEADGFPAFPVLGNPDAQGHIIPKYEGISFFYMQQMKKAITMGARSAGVRVADWEEGVVGLGSPVSQRPSRREARGAAPVEPSIGRRADRLFSARSDSNWWKGTCKGRTGLIPSNYGSVQLQPSVVGGVRLKSPLSSSLRVVTPADSGTAVNTPFLEADIVEMLFTQPNIELNQQVRLQVVDWLKPPVLLALGEEVWKHSRQGGRVSGTLSALRHFLFCSFLHTSDEMI